MESKLFEATLDIHSPRYVYSVDLEAGANFAPGSQFSIEGAERAHPVHDTLEKRNRHLNFFQRECFFFVVRTPRVRLPDGLVHLVEPDWAGRLKGFTLLFEALVLTLAREMTFAAVAPLAGRSWHRVAAICKRYVTLAADAKRRAVLFVADGEDALAVVRELHGSKVEPLKQGARTISKHFDGIIAWARTPQTNGFLEALNGLFQSTKRRGRGYGNFETIRTVIFLNAGKLDFSKINPHLAAR